MAHRQRNHAYLQVVSDASLDRPFLSCDVEVGISHVISWFHHMTVGGIGDEYISNPTLTMAIWGRPIWISTQRTCSIMHDDKKLNVIKWSSSICSLRYSWILSELTTSEITVTDISSQMTSNIGLTQVKVKLRATGMDILLKHQLWYFSFNMVD